MERNKPSKGKRDFLKFLSGVGLGAIAAEVYERVYGIPMLEKSFRAEINYWMNKYNKADEEIRKLESENKSLKEGQEKVNELTRTLNYEDELEKESNSAIAFYKQQMNEAIGKLKQIIEKYRILLGDERVSFESSTLKVLEDLKITQEKLLKVLPYFPLIKNLSFSPSKVVNDKIYDLSVQLEVISPLNTLEKVEVKLIPVEYEYFITDYGMRKEDYSLVFPPEETRVVKLNPKGLEKEIFEVNFKDLKGGKEYLIKVEAKDSDGNVKTEEIKTLYIREFENLGRLLYDKGIIIGVTYYPLYPDPHPWEWLEPMAVHPLLEKYDVRDIIVIAKHIDQATGHGINTFVFSWGIFESNEKANKRIHENILNFLSHPFSNQIYFYLLYELPHRLSAGNVTADEYGYYNLSDSNKWKVVVEDFKLFNKDFFQKENYIKIQNKPVVYLYWSKSLRGNITTFLEDIRKTSENSIFLIGDHAEPGSATWIKEGHPFIEEYVKHFDGWSTWAAGWPDPHIEEPYKEKFPKFLEKGYSMWRELATKYNRTFITSIIPGFINLRDPNFPRLPRDLDMFNEELKVALQYATTINGKRIIRIDTFNEFGEATGIEPTKEEGFSYLQTILKFFFP
jgi:hypothetical protein